MTAEEIRKIVDDERTEQLTAQVCRHWQVAADRLEGLVQELASAQGIYQGRSGKSPSGKWRIGSSEDHYLPLGEGRENRKD